jgi:hypothetical protein
VKSFDDYRDLLLSLSNADSIPCAYCGVPAQEYDHVPPLAWYGITRRKKKFREYPGVMACAECNNLLNDAPLLTVPERAEYVGERLRSRWFKILHSVVEWSPEEMEELGPTLRSSVAARAAYRAHLEARLSHADAIARKET